MTERVWCKHPGCHSDYCQLQQTRATLSLAEEGLAKATQENERLRDCWAEALANYAKQNTEVETLKRLAAQLHAIRKESLTCAMACPHSCNACERLYSVIRRALPQTCDESPK